MKCPKCGKDTLVKSKAPAIRDAVEVILTIVLFMLGIFPAILYLAIKYIARADMMKCINCDYKKII